MFSQARTILRIFGFDIRIDPSWLLIAALITWSLARQAFPMTLPGQSSGTYLAMAVVAMLAFFASLVLHELAHATVARLYGVETSAITLFLFGGVAELATEPEKALHEFRIAIAGPIISIVLALVFWSLGEVGEALSIAAPAVAVLNYLALINFVLAVFNLLPAFPLDGGRVLRAWLWHRRGDVLSATETAARSGSVLAYGLILLGLFALFQGGFIGGLWQILIGLFLLAAARSGLANQRIKSLLGSRSVGDLMSAPPIVVDPRTTLAELVDDTMLRYRVSFVPVVEDGVLLGHVTTKLLSEIDREHWANTQVGDVFFSLDDTLTVPPSLSAPELFRRMSETGERKFAVVDGTRLVGVVSLSDTLRLIGLLTSLGSDGTPEGPPRGSRRIRP